MSDIVTTSELFIEVEAMVEFRSSPVAAQPATAETAAERLTREQVMDRILSMNPTARMDFLGTFNDASLRDYLDHLQSATVPRGPQARWVRRGGTPAVAMAEARE